MKKVAIVGCGLIGLKRAQNISGAEVIAFVDIDITKAGCEIRQCCIV